VVGWGASVLPKDNRDDGVSRRQYSYVCWKAEFGEVKVVESGCGPKLGNPGIKRDKVTDFHGA